MVGKSFSIVARFITFMFVFITGRKVIQYTCIDRFTPLAVATTLISILQDKNTSLFSSRAFIVNYSQAFDSRPNIQNNRRPYVKVCRLFLLFCKKIILHDTAQAVPNRQHARGDDYRVSRYLLHPECTLKYGLFLLVGR